jgi:hypothetical protein
MTEVKKEGNLLNDKLFPAILDNTINFLLPCHDDAEKEKLFSNMQLELKSKNLKSLKTFSLKHPLNGPFLVFQTSLK